MPIKRAVELHFRVGELEDKLIDECAEFHGMSRSDILRMALNEFLRKEYPDRFQRRSASSTVQRQI